MLYEDAPAPAFPIYPSESLLISHLSINPNKSRRRGKMLLMKAVSSVLAASVCAPLCSSFAPSRPPVASRASRNVLRLEAVSRRSALEQGVKILSPLTSAVLISPLPSVADIEGVVTIPQSTAKPESKLSNLDGNSVTVFKTKSGLQYIDLVEGSGASPKYGNLVGIGYKAYIKLPDVKGKSMKLDEFDSERGYLIKHGNGRTVPGLDEGLHTMKVGGKRRIIVPPKLGYVSGGLGPIPSGPYGRWKLGRLLDQMVAVKGGNFIFDVEMKSIIEDEADQGYYDDESLSPSDFNTLRQNIESQQQAARGQAVSL